MTQILDIFEKIKSGVRILLCCYGPHEFCNNKQAVVQQHHDSLRTALRNNGGVRILPEKIGVRQGPWGP